MKFSKKILSTFIDLPKNWADLMEDVGLEIKSTDGDIINLELLANRGDHYCYMGLATEIRGRTGAAITAKETMPTEKMNGKPTLFTIDTDKCLAYSLLPLKKVSNLESRISNLDYITTMLPASGVNLILDVIDITNVAMLELGGPAHVYDADKINGKIHIRETAAGERAALLFHDGETELPAGTVVIADEEKILCVGGVIGCRAAEVDENTKNILFETALFDPVSIRKTAKALGVSSIASQIFERGGNMGAMNSGAARAKYLYSKIGWEQSGDWQDAMRMFDYKSINLPGDYVREQLEIDISDAEITERLARYGFLKTPDGYRIPTWRVWDIKGEKADLIEELARSIGYNNLPSRLPPVTLGATESKGQRRKSEIDSYLVHNGFYEVMTDNLYSPRHGELSPVAEHIKIANSVDGGYALMKNNAIVQAVDLAAKNLNVKNREIRAYEWGKVFQKDGEHNVFWGVMNGAKIDALAVKGLIANLLNGLGIEYEIVPADLSELKLHPKRGAKVMANGVEIGVLGEIHPALLAEFDIKNDAPVLVEFFGDAILMAPRRAAKYESPSDKIPSTRDISVAVPYSKPAGDIVKFIRKNYQVVADIEITDVFDKPKDGLRNITFSLTFAGEHSTESLNALIVEIMEKASAFVA